MSEVRFGAIALKAMGIASSFSRDDAQNQFDAFLNETETLQIEVLQELGEMCVTEMRLNKGYMMQSGALTSSSGYSVYKDGVAVHTAFEAASGAASGAAEKGMRIGMELANKVGKETSGVALVVVAGMNYAVYVESKGKNVISSAERLAQRELPRMISELISDVKAAAKT